MKLHRFLVTLGALTFVLIASATSAQYFGGNKVQYKTFAFEVLKTEHFDVYFYPEERQARAQAAPDGRTLVRAALAAARPQAVHGAAADPLRVPRRLRADQRHRRRRSAKGTGGVTEMLKRRIVLPLAPTLAGNRSRHRPRAGARVSVRHRGAHRAGGTARRAGVEQLPLWFIEGMAEYLSIGAGRSDTPRCGSATRRARRSCRRSGRWASSKYFPVSLGPGALGLRRRALGRSRSSGSCSTPAIRQGDAEAALKRVLNIDAKDALEATGRTPFIRGLRPARGRDARRARLRRGC